MTVEPSPSAIAQSPSAVNLPAIGSYACQTLAYQPGGELIINEDGSYKWGKFNGTYSYDGQITITWESGVLTKFGQSNSVYEADNGGDEAVISLQTDENKNPSTDHAEDRVCKLRVR